MLQLSPKNKAVFLSLLIIVLVFLAGTVYYFVPQHSQPMVKSSNLKYGDNPKQRLDIYSPEISSAKKLPVIIYVHGGGWSGGDKKNVDSKSSFFVNNGYVFVSVNHRLSPKATYTNMADDLASSVKWIYDHADTYHIDKSKINMIGHSSGGHLMMLIAANPKYFHDAGLSPHILNSVVNLEGPINLPDFINRMSSYKKVFGKDQNSWIEASPLTYADNKNLPPMFLVARGKESVSAFMEKTKKAGNAVEFYECATLSHSGVNKQFGANLASPEAKMMSNKVLAFLKKYN